MCDLRCELVVSTLASELVMICLICLTLQNLDVILGMNWLTANHILINYGKQKVEFPNLNGLERSSTWDV